MTDNAPAQAASTADLRLAYLERLNQAQSTMESAGKPKYITPRSLFKRSSNKDISPSGVHSAGNELVECINPKALQLRESIENATTFSNDASQRIDKFLGVLEESIRRMKSSASGLHWDGSSIEKTTRRCHQNVETAWKELISTLPELTASPRGPDTRQIEGYAEQGPSDESTQPPLQAESPNREASVPADKANANGPEDGNDNSEDKAVWMKLLGPTRTILKYVGAVTPLIPVVSGFIQCGVDVGNAIIDMLDGATQNAEAIQKLLNRVNRLSSMMDIFKDDKRSYCQTEPGMRRLKEFQRLCDPVQASIQQLMSQHAAGKLVFSSENAGTIQELNAKIDDALEQLDLYLRLNADHMLNALGEARLVDLLGDGYYGDKGYENEDGFCLEGTREEVLLRLDAWADGPSSSSVLLLKGQAGRGKSTIAKTTARRHTERGASSAMFFFRRGEKGLNARPVRALARQLVRKGDCRLRNAILQAVHDNQDVASFNAEEQFRLLIVEPLKKLESDPPPVMLVIDALDECGENAYSSSLLRIIAKHSPSLPPTTKILITSRPEQNIVRVFGALIAHHAIEDLDGIDTSSNTSVNKDLHAYLEDRLSAIGRQYGLRPGWQGAGTVGQLIFRAQGLFQWASTAMKLITQETDPNYGLQGLLNLTSSDIGLYGLYRQILDAAFPDNSKSSKELVQYVLGSLVASPGSMSKATLAYLWDQPRHTHRTIDVGVEIQAGILDRLRSLIMVPDSPDEPIQFLHTSVRDFLVDGEQSHDSRFYVDVVHHHHRLATACLDRMKRDLTNFDIDVICGPDHTSAEARDAFRQKVSPGLVYCARSWAARLSQVPHDEARLGLLDEFCRTNLIHWMEVLSLAEVSQEIIPVTQQGKDWIGLSETYPRVLAYELLDDAQRLCRQSFEIIATRPYHISRSVLFHCPLKTALRHFYRLGSGTPRIRRGPAYDNWPNSLWTKFIGGPVGSVAFSPDGKTIASASNDATVRLWSVDSAMQIGSPLIGHTGAVKGVAFSPDGQTIASASTDKTIRLWSVENGMQIGSPLTSHTGTVMHVAFSPDGKIIVSGSYDKTARLWSVESGVQISAPLTGHTEAIVSLAFSPDGKTIASASLDSTVRLWSVESGVQVGAPFTGHTRQVTSVAFSPDSKTIASSSVDKTVRLRSVESGMQIGAPLTGHTDGITSMVFSPDGKTIVSGSGDMTVRLWSVESGMQIGASRSGHTEVVMSVAFSPDGKTIASASFDGTVRLWNVMGGMQSSAGLTGHTKGVTSVAFSPDGKIIASASGDRTVRLWSVESGMQVGAPLIGHTDSISSVAFSRDGKTIASASNDATVRLWAVENGMQIKQMEANSIDDLPSFERDQGASIAADRPHITLHGSKSGGDLTGWMFRSGVRWFWLSREWYVEPPEKRLKEPSETLRLSLSNNILLIHHRNIPILDISDIL